MTRKQPNVLPITTDQQRYDTLGIVGNPYDPSDRQTRRRWVSPSLP